MQNCYSMTSVTLRRAKSANGGPPAIEKHHGTLSIFLGCRFRWNGKPEKTQPESGRPISHPSRHFGMAAWLMIGSTRQPIMSCIKLKYSACAKYAYTSIDGFAFFLWIFQTLIVHACTQQKKTRAKNMLTKERSSKQKFSIKKNKRNGQIGQRWILYIHKRRTLLVERSRWKSVGIHIFLSQGRDEGEGCSLCWYAPT